MPGAEDVNEAARQDRLGESGGGLADRRQLRGLDRVDRRADGSQVLLEDVGRACRGHGGGRLKEEGGEEKRKKKKKMVL